jgi:hypothetical protein
MALQSETEILRPYASLPPAFPQQSVTATVQIAAHDPVLAALQERSFRWYLQWAWPAEGNVCLNPMQSPEGKQALRIYDARASQSLLQLHQHTDGSWSGILRGACPLWQEIDHLFQDYQALGCPGKEAFQVDLDPQHAPLLVAGHDQERVLRDLYSI